MSSTKRSGPGLNARLGKWETVLALAFLIDLFEDKLLFPAQGIPSWGKVIIKMATVVGLFGILLTFLNRQLETGVSVAHGAGKKTAVPRIVIHALLFGALFTGIHWLKIGRWPWA
jgi:hypothetical protein